MILRVDTRRKLAIGLQERKVDYIKKSFCIVYGVQFTALASACLEMLKHYTREELGSHQAGTKFD
jgi:hypothetical protein